MKSALENYAKQMRERGDWLKWNVSPPKPIKGKRGLKTIGASSHKTEISNNHDEKNDSMILLSVI